jgi:flagellar biosynthesis/type III secretory pathway protein FliH
LSDAPAHWVPSPLLLKPEQTPRFLRAPWMQEKSDRFGPWRITPAVDPADTPHERLPLEASPAHPMAQADDSAARAAAGPAGDSDAVIDITAREVHPDAAADAAALRQAEARGHAQGLAEGLAQARAELEAERAREAELVRGLTIELRALADDADRFFEPLRRLALHLAEQLVRGELQASGQAIAQIVRQALAALDPPPGSQVIACVHPEDAALLQALSPGFLDGLKLQSEPQLHPGSVRLRLDDTVLDDLIEHRLQALVERLLVHTGPRPSVLLREPAPATQPLAAGLSSSAAGTDARGPLSASAPAAGRRRPAGLGDVIDATARPMPDDTGSAP